MLWGYTLALGISAASESSSSDAKSPCASASASSLARRLRVRRNEICLCFPSIGVLSRPIISFQMLKDWKVTQHKTRNWCIEKRRKNKNSKNLTAQIHWSIEIKPDAWDVWTSEAVMWFWTLVNCLTVRDRTWLSQPSSCDTLSPRPSRFGRSPVGLCLARRIDMVNAKQSKYVQRCKDQQMRKDNQAFIFKVSTQNLKPVCSPWTLYNVTWTLVALVAFLGKHECVGCLIPRYLAVWRSSPLPAFFECCLREITTYSSSCSFSNFQYL